METALLDSEFVVISCKIFFVHFIQKTQILNFLHFFFDRVNTCGATVSNNCSYIQNPNYPSSESSDCSFSITPLNADICQIRLDFDNFDITETTPIVGTCVDSFDVTSGSSRTYYTLCGTLSGQHSKFPIKTIWDILKHSDFFYFSVYLETGRKTTDQVAKFTIGTTSTVATWRIKVNQIECSSTSK